MLDLVFQNLTDDEEFQEDFFVKVLGKAIEESDLKDKDVGVSVNLVVEERIKELNEKYRNKDKVTDVLSFPMHDSAYQLTSLLADLDLGDIFICLSFAKSQAKLENVSIENKLAQLTVHGFLHLLGYDHEKSEEDAEKMLELEDRILNKSEARNLKSETNNY